MMKKIYLLAIFGIAAIAATAQTNDPDAKKILDGVSAKFKAFKSVQASFTYKVESAAGKVLSTKKGTVTMKGNKYRVSFSGQEIFCDGSTVWNYDKSANEVTISKLDASSGSLTPQKIFSDFYDKDFLYKLNGEKKQGTKVLQEIEMTPKDKSKNFHKVYVLIDKKSNTIYSTKVLENTNDSYSYTVTSMKTNLPVADDMFVFDKKKYPRVEEIDNR
jgi:outer membrane lipoprotein-sorting protein